MSFVRGFGDQFKSLSLADKDGEVEDSLVIGIDFGTTYSGVAWATRIGFEKDEVNVITSWPGSGREEGKAPTELWYDNDDEPVWGYEVPVDADPLRWFKLLLLHPEDLIYEIRESSYVVQARDKMEESGSRAVDLVADYLRLLWKHVLTTIERSKGEDVLRALPIHVVITVPAIWKGYARQAMEDAAKQSGILDFRIAGATQLSFAIEPEAAALSTLLEHGSGLRRGNVYVICDAGGGTVDLISYEVKSTNPIILQEAGEGTGGLSGGIFIDQRFDHLWKGRVGPKWKRIDDLGISEIMRNQWEHGIKPQFKSGKGSKQYIVSLPASLFVGRSSSSLNDTTRTPHIKDGRIHFLGTDIEGVFAEIATEIEKLVEGQIRSAIEKGLSITGIILVGGLGASPYLYERLNAAHSKAGITVLQSGGMKPRTAICRGAVIKGFLAKQGNQLESGNTAVPIMVASTVSRASYGVDFQTPFDAEIHIDKDEKWDKHEGRWMADNQMKWYLKRGEIVSKINPVRASWYTLYEKWQFDKTLSIDLLQCEDEVPPTRKVSSVQKLGTLDCNLDVQYSDLPRFESKIGAKVRKLSYELELVPSGASVEFVLYVDGRRQGGESAKIRFV